MTRRKRDKRITLARRLALKADRHITKQTLKQLTRERKDED